MRLSSQDKRLIKATNGRCFYCGFPLFTDVRRDWMLLRKDRRYVAEHKRPLKRGGTHDDNNMVCSCWNCNGQKSTFTVDEFRLIQGLRRGDLNFTFPLEKSKPIRRDWICTHSDQFEKSIMLASYPASIGRYKHTELAVTTWRGPR